MGTTKVLNKDADGKIVPGPAQLEVPPSGGTLLGGEEQPFQGKSDEDEPEALGPTGTHIYDADDFPQSGDTEKVQKPWAEDA
jgi:hypothetical protein